MEKLPSEYLSPADFGFAPNSDDTFDNLVSASERKRLDLAARTEEKRTKLAAAQTAESMREAQAWAKKGERGTLWGATKNKAAAFTVGSNRLAGHLATLPMNLEMGDALSRVGDEGLNAYTAINQYNSTKKLIAKERMLLAGDKGATPEGQKRMAALAQMESELVEPTPEMHALLDAEMEQMQLGGGNNVRITQKQTRRQLLDKAVKLANQSSGIVDYFDNNVKGIYNEKYNRDEFHEDLDQTYEENEHFFDKAGAAWDAGRGGLAAGEAIKGSLSLLGGALKDAVTNPDATLDYIVENIPQLVAGGAGGKGALLLTNAGYSADIFRKGVEAYQKEHGRLPPKNETYKILAWSASAGLAEQLGDATILKPFKNLDKAKKVVEETAEQSRKSVVKKLLDAGKTPVKGYLAEGATEGYQTLAENKAEGKEIEGKDIFHGAAIGAASGGGIATAGSVAKGAAKTLDKKAQESAANMADRQARAEAYQAVVETGDTTTLTDTESPIYDPSGAMLALKDRNAKEETTAEDKVATTNAAKQVLLGLQKEINDTNDAITALTDTTPEANAQREALKKKENELTAHFSNAVTTFQAMQAEAAPVAEAVETVTNATEATPEVENATQAVMGAIRAHGTANIEPEQAEAMADNTANNLDNSQREQLRNYAATRRAMDILSTSEVHNEVLYGNKERRMLGIRDHLERIGTALTTGDKSQTSQSLNGLVKFRNHMIGKQQAFTAAFAAVQKGGEIQLIPENGQWVQPAQPLSRKDLKKAGGAYISKSSTLMLENIGLEVDALNAAVTEQTNLFNTTFASQQAETAPDVTPAEDSGAVDPNVPPMGEAAPEAATAPVTEPDQEDPAEIVDWQEIEEKLKNPDATLADFTAEERGALFSASGSQSMEGIRKYWDAAEQQQTMDPVFESENETSAAAQPEGEASVAPETDFKTQTDLDTSGETQTEEETDYDLGAELTNGESEVKGIEGDHLQQYFGPRADKDTDVTSNALAKEKGFLDKLKTGTDFLLKYLTKDEFTARQNNALGSLLFHLPYLEQAADSLWTPKGEKVLKRHQPIYYFEKEGKLQPDVLAGILVNAYTWLATNAGGAIFNDDKAINSIMQRRDSADVPKEMRALLQDKGLPRDTVAASLGAQIIKTLGLKPNGEAFANIPANIELALGMYALNTLVTAGYLQINAVSVMDMRATLPEKEQETAHFNDATEVNEKTVTYFVRPVTHTPQGKKHQELDPAVGSIIDAHQEIDGLFDKLFGIDSQVTGATLEPVEQNVNNTKGTRTLISDELKEKRDDHGKKKHLVKQNVLKMVSLLSEENQWKLEGYEETTSHMHISKRLGVEGTNSAIVRANQELKKLVGLLDEKETGRKTPFYFAHEIWKQMRIGMIGNGVNIQANKFHRHVISMKKWFEQVSLDDAHQVEQFRLSVAESFGIKTDGMEIEPALIELDEKLDHPAIRKGLDVIKELKNADIEQATPAQQEAILAAVKEGGEKTFSLDGLVNYAEYELAQGQPGVDSFETNLFREVDGKTNGPILGLIQFGAALSPTELLKSLRKGGFYTKKDGVTNYSEWRKDPSNEDAYEELATRWRDEMEKMKTSSDTKPWVKDSLEGLGYLFGDIVRNTTKNPLTITVYGSSASSVNEKVGVMFRDAIYEKMEAAVANPDKAQGQQELAWIEEALFYGLGKKQGFKHKLTLDNALETELTPFAEKQLMKNVKFTYGQVLNDIISSQYGEFMAERSRTNLAVQTAFHAFKIQYDYLVNKRLQELIEDGTIPYREKTDEEGNKTKVPLADLPRKETDAIMAQLWEKQAMPLVHTYYSAQGRDPKEAMQMMKTAREKSRQPSHLVKQEYGIGLPIQMPNGETKWFKSAKTHSTEQQMNDPGVAPAVMEIHSTDAAIASMTFAMFDALNVHDALGFALSDTLKGAKKLNQHTLKVMAEFSIPQEAASAMEAAVESLRRFESWSAAEQGSLMKELDTRVFANMREEEQPLHYINNSITDSLVAEIRYYADKATKLKLEALAQVHYVSQYHVVGGEYKVTQAERDAFQAQADAIVLQRPTTWGKLGEPRRPVNKELQAKILNGASVKEVVKELRRQVDLRKRNSLPGFMLARRSILDHLMDKLPTDLKIVPISPFTDTENISEETIKNFSEGEAHALYDPASRTIYVRDGEFINHGMMHETLVHELVHAALSNLTQLAGGKLVDAGGNPVTLANLKGVTPATIKRIKENVKSLEQILAATKAHIKSLPKAEREAIEHKMANNLDNIDELLAWGLTNRHFQDEVLRKVRVRKRGNRIVNAFSDLLEALSNILFGTDKKPVAAQEHTDALSELIADAVELMELQQETQAPVAQVYGYQQMQMAAANSTQAMGMEQVFDALASTGTVRSSVAQQNYLRTLLLRVRDQVGEIDWRNQPSTPLDAFLQHKMDGTLPVVSDSLAAGFRMSDQEAYVMEQVEAATRTGMKGNSTAAKELNRLYHLAQRKLSYVDFLRVPEDQATQAEIDKAKQEYDFIFDPQAKADGTSDYLARFGALGITHPQVRQIFKDIPLDHSSLPQQLRGKTLAEGLSILFNWFMDTINGWVTSTNRSPSIQAKLDILVKEMAGIEMRKKSSIERHIYSVANFTLEQGDKLINSAKDKVAAVAGSSRVRNAGSAFVRAGGTLTSTVLGDNANIYLDKMEDVKNQIFTGKQGLTGALITEMRGATEKLQSFHELIRFKNKEVDQKRKQISDWVSRLLLDEFKDKGAYLTDGMKTALNKVVLKTDLVSLVGSYSEQEMTELIADGDYLNQEIAKLKANLNGLPEKHYYRKSAHALGYYMATGQVRFGNLMMNAHNIAHLASPFGSLGTPSNPDQAKLIIDQLATLYAIKYTPTEHRTAAVQVLRTEQNHNPQQNGFGFLLKMHRQIQDEAQELLFNSNPAQYMKGYTKEMINPHVSLVVADATQDGQLTSRSYKRGALLKRDQYDPNPTDVYMYVNRDGGLAAYMSGIFSHTGMRGKGVDSRQARLQSNDGTPLSTSRADTRAMMRANQLELLNSFNRAEPNWDPAKAPSRMAPIVDDQQNVMGYRYLMSEQVKDDLLEKHNAFNEVLAGIASSTADKVSSEEINNQAIELLHQEYQADYSQRPQAYLAVAPNSDDPRLREIWNMLPPAAKRKARQVWGRDQMLVRNDVLDMMFGYRKHSLTDKWNKEKRTGWRREAEMRTLYEEGYVMMAEAIFGKDAAGKLRGAEDFWQEMMKDVKDIIVIKNFFTLANNVLSNLAALYLRGVPISDIISSHREAFTGVRDYMEDTRELHATEQLLKLGQRQDPAEVKKLQQRVVVLNNRIRNNPVKELIDEGVFQTIIEDIDSEATTFTYKTRLAKRLSGISWIGARSENLKGALKFMAMTHDTKMYKALNQGTQISDFVARYTLHKHLTTRATNPLSKRDSIREIVDAFVNYDLLTHKSIQYGNDMGILWFTKYYLRIQKVIFSMFRDNPARAMAILATGELLDNPSPIDSSILNNSILNRFNNPLGMLIDAPGELITVNAGSELVGL